MGVKRVQVPAALARLERRFSSWRATRSVGERIPSSLWRAATKAAAEHGLNRTASVLSLDYYSLKKRVDDLDSESSSDAPMFVELSPGSLGVTNECVIEIENGDGARMRVHLKGEALPDLLPLSRLFLDGE